jgi:hypothetical protein
VLEQCVLAGFAAVPRTDPPDPAYFAVSATEDAMPSVSLADVVTAATSPSNGGTVILSGEYAVTSNLTVPSNVALLAQAGSRINISSGVTLTINGNLSAFRATLFIGSGSVSFGAAGASLLDSIYPEWFGTTGTAMQTAIDAAGTSRVPLLLAQKVYNVGTTALTITKDYTVIRGVGDPVFTPSSLPVDENCAILKYTSINTALTIGKNVGTTATFINNIVLDSMRIVCSSVNGKGIDAWMPTNSLFRRIGIYNSGGSPGGGSYGLRIRGGVFNRIEMLDVNSFERGIKLDGAAGTQLLTTTIFEHAYIHYCAYGIDATSLANAEFEDSIVESNSAFGIVMIGAVATFNDCWFENNPIAAYCDDAALTFNDCNFASGTQSLIQVLPGASKLKFSNPLFDMPHASSRLFDAATGTDASSKITIHNPRFIYAATVIAGTPYPSAIFGADRLPITSMPPEHFGLTANSIGANHSAAMTAAWSANFTAYTMRAKGQFLGVNLRFSSTVSAGTYGYVVKKNGTAIVTRTGLSAASTREFAEHLAYKLAAGDTLSINLTTNAAFKPTGQHFIAELVVAYGDDVG